MHSILLTAAATALQLAHFAYADFFIFWGDSSTGALKHGPRGLFGTQLQPWDRTGCNDFNSAHYYPQCNTGQLFENGKMPEHMAMKQGVCDTGPLEFYWEEPFGGYRFFKGSQGSDREISHRLNGANLVEDPDWLGSCVARPYNATTCVWNYPAGVL